MQKCTYCKITLYCINVLNCIVLKFVIPANDHTYQMICNTACVTIEYCSNCTACLLRIWFCGL